MRNVDSTLSRECVKMPLDRGDSKILTKTLLVPILFSLVTLLRAETLPGPTLLLLFDQLPGSLEGRVGSLCPPWARGLEDTWGSSHHRLCESCPHENPSLVNRFENESIWLNSQLRTYVTLAGHFRTGFCYSGSWWSTGGWAGIYLQKWRFAVCVPITEMLLLHVNCICTHVLFVFVRMSC